MVFRLVLRSVREDEVQELVNVEVYFVGAGIRASSKPECGHFCEEKFRNSERTRVLGFKLI